MTMLEVVFLGAVQGLTEFLPVSSSGHLLAARLLFDISDFSGSAFDAFLHLGTLGAVLVYFRRTWTGIAGGVLRNDEEGKGKRELLAKLAIATVPAAVGGYLFQDGVEELRSVAWLAGALGMTAVVLWVSDVFSVRAKTMERARYNDAAYIGLMQVLALLPGVSRSGVTIAGGRLRGLSRSQATKFSFLMSAPIIAGASLSSLSALWQGHLFSPAQLGLGVLVSFASGLFAIKVLLHVVEKISLKPFAVYLVALAAIILLYG